MSSMIQFLGTGIVAANKNTNTDQIMVYLPSKFPMADGKVEATAEQQEKQSLDAQGNTVNSKVLMSNAVPAFWKSMGDSNRLSSPDVREGSEVSIYQVTGQKKYYWTTWGMNAKTMRLETVMYGWSASPATDENITDPDKEDFNIDNFYTFMISTHTGKVSFRTSQKNQEKTVFEVMIDAMAGKIMVGGKEKSYLVLDDIERSLTYTNADGSVFNINKQVLTAYTKDKINLNADKEINLLTKKLNIQCDTWQVQAKNTQFQISSSWNVDCPKTTWKGDIDLTGNIDQKGGIKSTEEIYSASDVRSNVSLNNHLTTGVKSGSDKSGGPV
ncbi:putative structural protein [Erwinia phage vB_EamM_Joad]|uniref:Putative structural protein n=1 Tax=Erwinia phage vB_EamM_Joad TaxID=2026081 RepID=A0A223LIX6_9CAUD|nr:putative structural protein [Erwinia phage vB_EamM_Joad]